MSLPSYIKFIEPLLRFLVEQTEPIRARDVYEAVADIVGLTDEQKEELLPSRDQAVYRNRIGWAHDRLKKAGLSKSARRGYWEATDKGRVFVDEHPDGISDEELKAIWKVPQAKKAATEEDEGETQSHLPLDDEHESPQERIENAIVELNQSVGAELLELIHESSPQFFEALVLDLLHTMGYGTSKADLQRVGGSGDGGIDGIISLDKLGLEKVYVQAKRWQANVGRPELQSFFGALAGRKANKGVFITTSGFTREAREFALAVSDSIVLVNGARLTELMIEHGVGVSHKPLKIAKVDSDYFEEG